MSHFVFERIIYYNTKLDLDEIEKRLLYLIKRNNDIKDKFTGTVKLPLFMITPILGNRENFKIHIIGEIKDNNKHYCIKVTYTIDKVIRCLLYALFIIFFSAFVFLKLSGIIFKFGIANQGEYLLIATPAIMSILLFTIYEYQVDYYSKFLTQYLSLLKTSNPKKQS